MNVITYIAGNVFYHKLALVMCISHKRCNPNDNVILLTSDAIIPENYEEILINEGIEVYKIPEVNEEFEFIKADGDTKRFYTFARWACYLKISKKLSRNEIDALLDPDILTLENWTSNIKNIEFNNKSVAFTRQFNWDNFINGGFIVAKNSVMMYVGDFMLNQVKEDVAKGAYVKSPYDQIYWNRYFDKMELEEISLNPEFIKLAFEKKTFNSKLVHQIDFKGFLFNYEISQKIINEYSIFISESELKMY